MRTASLRAKAERQVLPLRSLQSEYPALTEICRCARLHQTFLNCGLSVYSHLVEVSVQASVCLCR